MTTLKPNPETAVRDSSIAVLSQLFQTLDQMSDEQYVTPDGSGATVGAHVRHTLDHFRKLVDGHSCSDVVAYDRRDRGGSIETDKSAASSEARALIEAVGSLDSAQLLVPVRICAMVCGSGAEAEIGSTLVRELWFATHHAIHHNALLKPIASSCGMDLPATFGRAPSTVNHEQA